MGVLCDTQIRELVGIEPFEDNKSCPGRISWGVSSYGTTSASARDSRSSRPRAPGEVTIVDPKKFTDDLFVEVDASVNANKPGWSTDGGVIIPPNSFALRDRRTITVPRGCPRRLRRQVHLPAAASS